MAAAVDAGRRGRDLVVIDLPRRFDESSLLALTAADRAYLVVPAELRACAAALHLPLAATLRSEPRLVKALEGGQPPAGTGRGPLAEVCRQLLADLSPRQHRARMLTFVLLYGLGASGAVLLASRVGGFPGVLLRLPLHPGKDTGLELVEAARQLATAELRHPLV